MDSYADVTVMIDYDRVNNRANHVKMVCTEVVWLMNNSRWINSIKIVHVEPCCAEVGSVGLSTYSA